MVKMEPNPARCEVGSGFHVDAQNAAGPCLQIFRAYGRHLNITIEDLLLLERRNSSREKTVQ